jgi:hypothetical protein
MATVVTSSIGYGGDYSTLQAWEDAAPANLVTADVIWRGELKKQTFSNTSGTLLTISGSTVDSTHYKELTTAPGASFRDHPNVATNPLRPDGNHGALLICGGSYLDGIQCGEYYTRFTNLQIQGTNYRAYTLNGNYGGSTSGQIISNCLIEGSTYNSSSSAVIKTSYSGTILNTLVVGIYTASGRTVIECPNVATFKNCTFISLGGTTTFVYTISYSSVTVINCAAFGFTNANETSGTNTITTSYTNASANTTNWSTTTFDTTTGSGFENITSGTYDFRLKSTSALLGVGTIDTDTFYDVRGYARNNGSYDIGAWEFRPGFRIIKRTIGAGGDYSTLQAWNDDCPTSLTAIDAIWQGEMISSFDTTGTQLTVSGTTTDSTRYKHLTAAEGYSFADKKSVRDTPLRFNVSNGVYIRALGGNYSKTLILSDSHFKISRLQIQENGVFTLGGQTLTFDACILEFNGAVGNGKYSNNATTTASNCVFIRGINNDNLLDTTASVSTFFNCAFICPSNIGPSSSSMISVSNYAGGTFINCYFAGFTTIKATLANCMYTACYTDGALLTGMTAATFGTNNINSLNTYDMDLRLPKTSRFINVGSATGTLYDITGMIRIPYITGIDIGPWEYDTRYSVKSLPTQRTANPIVARRRVKTSQPKINVPVATGPIPKPAHLWALNVSAANKVKDSAGTADGVFGVGISLPSGNYWVQVNSEHALLCNDGGTGTIASTELMLGNSSGSGGPVGNVFSFVARIRLASTGLTQTIYAASTNGLQFRVTSTNLLQIVKSSTAVIGTSNTAMVANVDYDVGFSYDGTVATYYLNGAQDGSGSSAQTFTHTQQYYFFNQPAAPAEKPGNGFILSRAAQWNSVLNAANFRALAGPGFWQLFAAPPTPTVFDLSMARNPVSIQDSRLLTTAGPALSTVAPAFIGATNKWATVPRFISRINYANPITSGLVFCAVPTGGGWLDIVSGLTTVQDTVPTYHTSRRVGDPITQYMKSSTGQYFPQQTALDRVVGPYTLFADACLETNASFGTMFASYENTNNRGMIFMLDDVLTVTNTLVINTFATGYQSANIDSLGANSEQFGARVMFTADGSNFKFYTANALNKTAAYADLPVASSLRQTSICSACSMSIGAAWNRVLSLAEYNSLYDNPSQLLAKRSHRFWGSAA